ncbi:TPA: nucleotide sugar dehydrogenase [Campylobacter lari]|nr:nucleotide sugar dehydrogenase [Campylobacter lari]HEC1803431.1 nucleotide sugar dehydrogenase [Campylobacter lari]
MKKDIKIAVVGLGYVGLPLAIEFSKKYNVVGFDISQERVVELQNGFDKTKEISQQEILCNKKNITFTYSISDISKANFYIITVPTPIDSSNNPDLTPIKSATKAIASILKKNDIVIYESTVYPGCTEEICVPILEEISGLVYNKDFYCGYSPERINPGDKTRKLTDIKKITSGSNENIAEVVDNLYSSVISAGTYKASCIKVAEAAKIIENAQRDVNIAFMNEISCIFQRVGIDTLEVIEAASTKWNFLKFTPGLVGGHCIGVDPYYLIHKSESHNYSPRLLLSSREVNNNMSKEIVTNLVKKMIQNGMSISKSSIAVFGVTFKENCTDIRNSKVIDIIKEMKEYTSYIDIYDPYANSYEVSSEYGLELSNLSDFSLKKYQVIIIAVAHDIFMDISFGNDNNIIIYDLKGILKSKNRNILRP